MDEASLQGSWGKGTLHWLAALTGTLSMSLLTLSGRAYVIIAAAVNNGPGKLIMVACPRGGGLWYAT